MSDPKLASAAPTGEPARRRSDRAAPADGATPPPADADTNLVLLVDDAADVHKLLALYLRPLGLQLVHAHSGKQGLTLADEHRPTLILLDYRLPDLDGMAVLASLKSHPELASIPVMLMTSDNDEETLAKAFSLGAADYVHKPLRVTETRARVGAALQAQRLLSQLRRQAHHDALTDLPNRAFLSTRIQHVLERRSAMPNRHFAVLFFDFDRFKNINDSLGHDFGDELLRQIAARFVENLRLQDAVRPGASADSTVARIGGDEFVVLLDDLASPEDANVVADRLLTAFSKGYAINDQNVFSTASVGIVTSGLGHSSVEELLRDADTAMYEAKAAGRGRYVVFDDPMRARAQHRLSMEDDLRRAIELGQFHLVYQPIVSLGEGRIVSVEALLRWQHPDRGDVRPDEFVPVAEETGLIVPIGEWVLGEACRQLHEWRTAAGGRPPSRINVNLSRQQLLLPDIAARVEEIIGSAGISPEDVTIEVIGSDVMKHAAPMTSALCALTELGVEISIDDFGVGHSSLACLQDVRVGTLKIDRSFIANLCGGRNLMAMVSAIIELARDLEIETIAEGIETFEQLVSLHALNCDYGQGFYLSKPLPADAVPTASLSALTRPR